MTKINYSNISPELIKVAQNSLKNDGKIDQKEYDNLVKVALKDKILNRDEQLFIASLDNKNVISQLMDSKFNPKSISFNVDKLDNYNPILTITRNVNNKESLVNINVRAINKNQNLDFNIKIGKNVCEYVSSHLISSNKFDNLSNAFGSIVSLPSRAIYMSYRLVENVTPINKALDYFSTNIKNAGSDYSYVKNISSVAHKLGSGNCGENAALSAVMLANYGVSPVETFSIPGHSFAVIGRDPSSEMTDPKTWGNTAVIVDPWNNIVVPVKDIVDNLSKLELKKEYDVAK
jgi:hypothetical protein